MTNRCVALDDDANRCEETKTFLTEYFGDSEIYRSRKDEPNWVDILLCRKHGGYDRDAEEKFL